MPSMTRLSSNKLLLIALIRFVVLTQLVHCFANMSESPRKKQKLDEAAKEDSENLGPWRNRWDDKRIGFHLSEVNPVIEKYAELLLPKSETNGEEETCSNTRIFLPLCGKTIDLAYLVPLAGEVVGVEGIRTALEEFSKEQPDLMVENKGCRDGFERFDGNKISLLKGDFFELDSNKTNGKFGAIYDRASMVAIQPHLRKAYTEVLGKLIAPQGKILLVALDRRSDSEAARAKGPPFSLPEATVRELYEGLNWVESVTLLEESDRLEGKPEDRERYPDLDQLMETVFLIQAN